MTDKMLFSLSIFLTGLGAGIALAAFVAPHRGRLIGSRSEAVLGPSLGVPAPRSE